MLPSFIILTHLTSFITQTTKGMRGANISIALCLGAQYQHWPMLRESMKNQLELYLTFR